LQRIQRAFAAWTCEYIKRLMKKTILNTPALNRAVFQFSPLVFISLNYRHIAYKHRGNIMLVTEKSLPNRSFRLAEENGKFTLNALLLVFSLVEIDMLYATSKMQIIYQHIFMDIGNITISFPFTALLFRIKIFRPILRISAHVASTHQLVIQTIEVLFGITIYIPGDKIR
jgi:hypothetical protein